MIVRAMNRVGISAFRAGGLDGTPLYDDLEAPSPLKRPGGEGEPVTFLGVEKDFSGRTVLAGVDLHIEARQFVAVVGRSGCGKTTLLNLLAGLIPPDAGVIRVGGEPVNGLQEKVRVLFQEARLLPWLKVLSNVGVARGPDWKRRAQEALEDVGLGARAADWPSVLSGGQRQRVALARALVSRPAVLLLDEPFGALDALTRAEMHELLLRIWSEHGVTIILITHDVGEAVALADRVIVLRDGRAALDLSVDLDRPRRRGDARAAALEARILSEV